MLNHIPKILTGEMLKVLSNMGHGDVLILADANFPGDTIAKETTYGKLIRCPGTDVVQLYEAIHELFPLDVDYSASPAVVMALTESDKAKGMATPSVWEKYEAILKKRYPDAKLTPIGRLEFYERAKRSFVVIQTGEERQYGNLLLVKGCVLWWGTFRRSIVGSFNCAFFHDGFGTETSTVIFLTFADKE